jgi:hypothetical protein
VDLNRQWKAPVKSLHPTVSALKAFMLAQRKVRDVAMYIDLHGHSRKYNVFMYGCEDIGTSGNKKLRARDRERERERERDKDLDTYISGGGSSSQTSNNPSLQSQLQAQAQSSSSSNTSIARIFPKIFASHEIGSKYVNFADCSFQVRKGRESTARVVVARELNIPCSFTLEATFCGLGYGPLKHCHMNIGHMCEVGSSMCDAMLQFCVQEGYCRDTLLTPIPAPHYGGGKYASSAAHTHSHAPIMSKDDQSSVNSKQPSQIVTGKTSSDASSSVSAALGAYRTVAASVVQAPQSKPRMVSQVGTESTSQKERSSTQQKQPQPQPQPVRERTNSADIVNSDQDDLDSIVRAEHASNEDDVGSGSGSDNEDAERDQQQQRVSGHCAQGTGIDTDTDDLVMNDYSEPSITVNKTTASKGIAGIADEGYAQQQLVDQMGGNNNDNSVFAGSLRKLSSKRNLVSGIESPDCIGSNHNQSQDDGPGNSASGANAALGGGARIPRRPYSNDDKLTRAKSFRQNNLVTPSSIMNFAPTATSVGSSSSVSTTIGGSVDKDKDKDAAGFLGTGVLPAFKSSQQPLSQPSGSSPGRSTMITASQTQMVDGSAQHLAAMSIAASITAGASAGLVIRQLPSGNSGSRSASGVSISPSLTESSKAGGGSVKETMIVSKDDSGASVTVESNRSSLLLSALECCLCMAVLCCIRISAADTLEKAIKASTKPKKKKSGGVKHVTKKKVSLPFKLDIN